MLVPWLATKSLLSRKLATGLTVASIALSVSLFIGVEKIRLGAREGFASTVSRTDLIVGARTGSVQLLLYTIFHLGNATNNISMTSYDKIAQHEAVAWTIPLSLGDSHRGFRVVATDKNFYEHYTFHGQEKIRFTQGKLPQDVFAVALGSDVAAKLGYQLGQKLVLSHGYSDEGTILQHDDRPFEVVGVLAPTHTPLDRALFITLEGMEAIHVDWEGGTPPKRGAETAVDKITQMNLRPMQITAFLLGAKTRLDTLYLQRFVNTFAEEPMLAIIPGVAMVELWSSLGYAEAALRAVSAFVVLVGLFGMLVSLYTAAEHRRREVAVLRSVGTGLAAVVGLLCLESFSLTLAGVVLGVAGAYGGMSLLSPLITTELGVYLPLTSPTALEMIYLVVVLVIGAFLGMIPAWRAYKQSLADGLAVHL